MLMQLLERLPVPSAMAYGRPLLESGGGGEWGKGKKERVYVCVFWFSKRMRPSVCSLTLPLIGVCNRCDCVTKQIQNLSILVRLATTASDPIAVVASGRLHD